MTDEAMASVVSILLTSTKASIDHIGLHGDCVGADADFNKLCLDFKLETWCRPCTITSMRAFTKSTPIADPAPPLVRNREIVKQCTFLIACPSTFTEEVRSGTWATVRYAREAEKTIYIVFPDGSLVTEVGSSID
jgi:hypothetical protein